MKQLLLFLFSIILFSNVVNSFFIKEEWLEKIGYYEKKKISLISGQKFGLPKMKLTQNGDERLPDGYPEGPFTEDFQRWINESDIYIQYDFPALHLGINASYGGRQFKDQKIDNEPVIFIHGNSDGALYDGTEYSSGFSDSIKYYLENGYTSAELYAVTWGDRKLENSFNREHDCNTTDRIRKFVDAVIEYTGAPKINIVAHSMGVTYAQQIIKGTIDGIFVDQNECIIGEPINDKISTLVGIGGASFGICGCYTNENITDTRVCGKDFGFFPGYNCTDEFGHVNSTQCDDPILLELAETILICTPQFRSIYLNHLLYDPAFKYADHVFSIWSEDDEIIGSNNVWGMKTSKIDNSDDVAVFNGLTHHGLKNDPSAIEKQFNGVHYKSLNGTLL